MYYLCNFICPHRKCTINIFMIMKIIYVNMNCVEEMKYEMQLDIQKQVDKIL